MAVTKKKKRPVSPKRHSFLGIRIKRYFTLGALAIVLLFGLLGLFGKNGVLDTLKWKSLHHNLQSENQELLEEQEQLKMEISRLQDPKYIEFLAREKLGLMRSNEIFLVLDESGSTNH